MYTVLQGFVCPFFYLANINGSQSDNAPQEESFTIQALTTVFHCFALFCKCLQLFYKCLKVYFAVLQGFLTVFALFYKFFFCLFFFFWGGGGGYHKGLPL